MYKGLVISWFYPPINSSEALVTYKLLKRSDCSYDIFTQNNNMSWSYKTREKNLLSDNITCIYSKSDALVPWVKEGISFLKENCDKYDFMMSRSMPPESHLIALEIKKKNPKIKWIASFGDPIANNPYVLFSKPESSPYSYRLYRYSIRQLVSPARILKDMIWKYKNYKSSHFSKKETRLEKNIILNADMLIFNNKEQKEYMLKGYNDAIKNKGTVIPHTYEEELYPGNKTENNKKIIMSYIGHLDDIRSPRILLKAVNRLNKKVDDLKDKLEIDFYGNMSDADKLYIINNELVDIVRVKKPISYIESLKIMKNSDWLIQVDARLNTVLGKNIFFAAKLADYIGAGIPIFGLTMLEGASADILRNTNNLVVSHSISEAVNYLYKIINGYKIEINKDECLKFSNVYASKLLDEKIYELFEGKSGRIN